MSPRPGQLSVSDHHHNHHSISHASINPNHHGISHGASINPNHHSISHGSIQSLPVPGPSGNRFGSSDPRYTSTAPNYETSSISPASTSSFAGLNQSSVPAISYFPHGNSFQQPTSYPQSATASSYGYSSSGADSRPRTTSIQSPTSVMAPRNRSSSGSTKSVSPSLGSSVRDQYATMTPGVARHSHHTMASRPPPQHEIHSPLTSASTIPQNMPMGSPTHDHGSNGLNNAAGPPLQPTTLVHRLNSADGHNIRPEIHARVDKGFFLCDRDWTCYRRNYFSVICSYSLVPQTYSLPLYVVRSAGGPPEHILSFAMCISAVVDGPAGKTVELVQHTPKRDKGPQLRPQKIKLHPQPVTGMGYGSTNTNVIQQQQQQQPHHPQQSLDYDPSFPQQSQQQQQQTHIAVFDRIQFKSATANNGKRRAAQQYYHLLVELWADVGPTGSSAPQPSAPGTDERWVKVAQRVSAPMVVRGRSPGHYADERRASSTASPGGGSAGGSHGTHPAHAPSHGSAGSYLGGDPSNPVAPGGHQGVGMNSMQQGMQQGMQSSPQQQSTATTMAQSPSTSHYTPIDPSLNEPQTYPEYTYVHTPLQTYEPQQQHLPTPPGVDSGYDSAGYQDRKSEHPLETGYEQHDISEYSTGSSYTPTTGSGSSYQPAPAGDRYAHSQPKIKEEPYWNRDHYGSKHAPMQYGSCGGKLVQTTGSSRGLFPDIPSIGEGR
ncbi:hypothetical protein BZA77DRAFT_253808 [Pyronema omphalodes]|nr:hypothetical protein BZA77DRAFT_253808 [Pyronema omphalodes]